jgi:hypothetical protein
MVKVYFEMDGSHAELVEIFDDEDTYIACLPALEKLRKKHGFDLVTESIVDSMGMNELDKIVNP